MSNMLILGAGDLWAKPAVANPTPVRIATLKKLSIQLTKDPIDATAAYEFPVDTAGGKASGKGKATVLGFETELVKSVFGGVTSSTGYTAMAVDEAATIPATPFQVTVANPTGGISDFGVLWSADNTPLTRVASAPATGQYSVNEATGVYTFAAADTGKAVKVSYSYAVSGSGLTVDIKSSLIGASPSYLLQGWNTYSGKKIGYRIPTAKFTGLSFEFSPEAHVQPEYDFTINALPGQTAMQMFFA